MKDKKATGDGKVPGDVLKSFGKGGQKVMTQLNRNVYENGE